MVLIITVFVYPFQDYPGDSIVNTLKIV